MLYFTASNYFRAVCSFEHGLHLSKPLGTRTFNLFAYTRMFFATISINSNASQSIAISKLLLSDFDADTPMTSRRPRLFGTDCIDARLGCLWHGQRFTLALRQGTYIHTNNPVRQAMDTQSFSMCLLAPE